MAISMIKDLSINNLQIIDITSNQLASSVNNTNLYKLCICINNINSDDTLWYDYIQLRVVPVGLNIQFYEDSSFTIKKSSNRFDSSFIKLSSKESKWHTIYFKWTGTSTRKASLLKFDIGLYAHELKIDSKWKKLSHPI
jgi:hypothetical protein